VSSLSSLSLLLPVLVQAVVVAVRHLTALARSLPGVRLDLHCGGGEVGGGAGGEGGVHGGGGGVVRGEDGRGLRSVWWQRLVRMEMFVVMMVNIRYS